MTERHPDRSNRKAARRTARRAARRAASGAARPAAPAGRICPTCGAAAVLEWQPGSEAVVATVAAALERRPVQRCDAGHRTPPADVLRTAGRTVDEVLLGARGSRLRPDRCAACREPLVLPVRRTRRSVTIVDPAVAVHTLHLDVPVVRCGECGQEQVPSRSQADLAAVVTAAYRPI